MVKWLTETRRFLWSFRFWGPFSSNEMVPNSSFHSYFSLRLCAKSDCFGWLEKLPLPVWSGYELFGTVCAHMQCAVQWVQQKEGFGIGQHTPSSGWVLYYIATHRACCTSGLNQKLNQKNWNHLKAGRNHFVFISLSSVWNSFFLLVIWLQETSSADCSPHDPLLQKPDHRTLQLISTSLLP